MEAKTNKLVILPFDLQNEHIAMKKILGQTISVTRLMYNSNRNQGCYFLRLAFRAVLV